METPHHRAAGAILWLLRHGPIAALLVLVAAVYGTTLNYELSFDDTLFFPSKSPTPSQGSLIEVFRTDYFGISKDPTTPSHSPYYRPLPLGVIQLERAILGERRAGFRFLHTALHLVNILLVFAVVRRFFGAMQGDSADHRTAALVAATIFAFSAFTVDAVLFLSDLCDLMALCFVALSVCCFFSFLSRQATWPLIGLILSSIAALLSKENAFALPAILFAMHGWRRDPGADRRAFIGIGVSALTAVAVFILRSFVVSSSINTALPASVPLIPPAAALALRHTLLPIFPVLEERVVPGVGHWLFWLGSVGLMACGYVIIRFRSRLRALSAGTFIWLAALMPSFMALGATGLFAPRYLYLPALGSSLALGHLVTSIPTRHVRTAIYVGIGLMGLAMATRTVAWKDGVTLWSEALMHDPQSLTAHVNLGNLLAERGQLEEAFALEITAAELAADKGKPCEAAAARTNAANILLDRAGNPKGARALYEQSVTMCPEQAYAAWVGLSTIHAERGAWADAEKAARQAIRLAPSDPTLLVFLGGILMAQGKTSEAKTHFAKALSLAETPQQRADIHQRIKAAREDMRRLFEENR